MTRAGEVAAVLLPYRRVRILSSRPPSEAAQAIGRLLDSTRGNGHRLEGSATPNGIKLVCQPRPWQRMGYLPVVIGEFTAIADEVVLDVRFRPPLYEMVFLPAWAVFTAIMGAPWFGIGGATILHVINFIGGFLPEVERISGLLKSELAATGAGEGHRKTV